MQKREQTPALQTLARLLTGFGEAGDGISKIASLPIV
jgi:hypothetical protein